MRLPVVLLLTATLALAAESRQVANYDIKARLDTATHTVVASEHVSWLNDSPDSVPTLQFHLYMNAFRNSQSTFYRESGGQLRGDKFKGDQWGWVKVKKLTVAGADLTGAGRFIHPDDDNAEDRTVLEVPLPQPVKPGATLEFDLEFETRLPEVFARTGFHKDFYLVGQWFPKLGVWEKAGMRYATAGAWNCHQFHANSEFYANFGRYRVELDVPSNMVVGATGEQQSKQVNGARAVYRFEQENVTDFVWTAQPTYLREERMFLADKETTPAEIAAVARLHGIPEAEARLTDVKMIALVQPEHREQIERHFHSLRTAIKGFGLLYGHYPYKTITVVDPPYGGGGAGGMEYPTFITAGTSFRLPPESHGLEMVTVHEFGHQFWMELVASNEFEESWLDEGFNTYSTSKIIDRAYPPSMMNIGFFGLNLWKTFQLPRMSEEATNRIAYVGTPMVDDLVRRAWDYYDGTSYGVNSYMRTGVTLRTLENVLGGDVMARVMRAYHQRWRFAHPNSRDFQRVVNEVSGRNMDWFFEQFVFGNRILDYRVGDVSSKAVRSPFGVFEQAGAWKTISSEDASKADEKKEKEKDFKQQYQSTVKIRRLGDAVAPVEISIHFKDGVTEKRQWDGQYRWVKYTFLRASEIDWVEVDPRRVYQLDVSYSNNSWQQKYNIELSTHWTSKLVFWFQNALLWLTALA